MAIRNLKPSGSEAVARLMATAAEDADTEDEDNKLTDDDQILALKEGVAAALSKNQQLSEALHKALDEFDKWWIDEKNLTTEGVVLLKKGAGTSAEDVEQNGTAKVSSFLKYLIVPDGLEQDVTMPEEPEGTRVGDEEEDDKEGTGGNGDDTDTDDDEEDN